ncbi:unnamed protein product [Trifolium pratense]|uniref:Uncharacterized protein n=1 Tax=Trifolium pratense TaxID=57577 RepID=A0ACB0LTI4_TRIPR|nr:unnamed protein product [Trifolium pratense]
MTKAYEKNDVSGEGRNRRALLDIGNVVTLKGVEVKANRPVTSFCAQQFANAEAAKVNENNKKQACANVPTASVDGVAAVSKRVPPKPAVQKKVTAKPKPVEVIEISDEKDGEDMTVHKKKEADVLKSSQIALSQVVFVHNYLAMLKQQQGFRSSPSANLPTPSEVVRKVEAKYPDLVFKQQLTAYVEKIYGILRDNLKKELASFISLCIQAPRTSKGVLRSGRSFSKDSPMGHWQSIIESLNTILCTMKENFVPPVLVQKIFSQTFSYINIQLFNSLLLRRDCCPFSNGEYVKVDLAELEMCLKSGGSNDATPVIKPPNPTSLFSRMTMGFRSSPSANLPTPSESWPHLFRYVSRHQEHLRGLLLRRDCCPFSNGEYVKVDLAELELWCCQAKEEYAGTSWDELKYIRQAVGFLVFRNVLHSWKLYAMPLVPSGALFPLMQWTRRAQFVVVIVQTIDEFI